MDDAERAREIFGLSRMMTEGELEFIKSCPPEEISDLILEGLAYPNLNVLVAADYVPDKRYEQQLLAYRPEEMQEDHAIHWMSILGKLGSGPAFERIVPYTETGLFHQAYLALAGIDAPRAFALFERFLDTRCHLYGTEKDTRYFDSGCFTLTVLIDHHGPEEARKYNCSDPGKKRVVLAALGSR